MGYYLHQANPAQLAVEILVRHEAARRGYGVQEYLDWDQKLFWETFGPDARRYNAAVLRRRGQGRRPRHGVPAAHWYLFHGAAGLTAHLYYAEGLWGFGIEPFWRMEHVVRRARRSGWGGHGPDLGDVLDRGTLRFRAMADWIRQPLQVARVANALGGDRGVEPFRFNGCWYTQTLPEEALEEIGFDTGSGCSFFSDLPEVPAPEER